MRMSIIWMTDGFAPKEMTDYCLYRLREQCRIQGHQLIVIRQLPEAPRCHASIYRNILDGLKVCNNKMVAIAEHDCLYSDDYWTSAPKDRLSYSQNVFYLTKKGFARRDLPGAPLSSLIAPRDLIKVAVEVKMSEQVIKIAEPGLDRAEMRDSGWVIDIRHGKNFTGARDKFIGKYSKTFQNFNYKELWKSMGRKKKVEVVRAGAGDGITCIIPARVEKYLGWTVDNVRRTAPAAEIIIVHDGWTDNLLPRDDVRQFVPVVTPQGVGQSRHYGLKMASNDICMLLDAHMDFAPGWADKMADEVRKNNKALVSSMSAVLRENRLDINNPEKIQGGARINSKSLCPFDPEWVRSEPGEIQCILGGAYAISKSWYFGGLCQPWVNAFGWGSSEQVISLVNSFAGGVNILSDALTGHLYRHVEDIIETRFTPMTRIGMWYNRLRLIDLMPVDKSAKAGAVEHITSRLECAKNLQFINELLRFRPIKNDQPIKDMMAKSSLTWNNYLERWYPEGFEWPVRKDVKAYEPQKHRASNDSMIIRGAGKTMILDKPNKRFV